MPDPGAAESRTALPDLVERLHLLRPHNAVDIARGKEGRASLESEVVKYRVSAQNHDIMIPDVEILYTLYFGTRVCLVWQVGGGASPKRSCYKVLLANICKASLYIHFLSSTARDKEVFPNSTGVPDW